MSIKSPTLRKRIALSTAVVGRQWCNTLDWKAVYYDPTVDPFHPRHLGRCVNVAWHEYVLAPVMLHGRRKMVALASEHGDGEIVGRAIEHLGWGVVRGSSSRGAASGLLRLLRDDERSLNITPDGPRGPRRVMQQGPIFLASKLGLPLVCVGYAYDRPWRLRSWDRFAIPRPFTRGRSILGPPLHIPSRLDRAGLESHRLWFERLLNWLTIEAETWADSGAKRPGEMPMLVGAAPPMLARQQGPGYALPQTLMLSWSALGNPPIGVASATASPIAA